MKISYFTLLFCDDDFETDLRINYKHKDVVSMDVIRNGNKIKSQTIVLNGEVTLDGAAFKKGLYDTKFSLKITSSDDTNFIAVVFDRKTKNVVLTITPILITDLKEVIKVETEERKAEAMVSFGDPDKDPYPYLKFRGEPGVSYLQKNFYEVVHFIAKYLYYQYPDRKDRRLTLLDCTPLQGDPVDNQGRLTHPAGSHNGGHSLDINYFTFNTNYTHFWGREDTKIGTVIWENEDAFPNMTLLKEVFDWERNWEYFKLMKEFIPDSFYMINEALVVYIRDMVMSKIGYQEYTKTFGTIQGDTNVGWNHHLHCHNMLGQHLEINLEGSSIKLCNYQDINSFGVDVSNRFNSDNTNSILEFISKYKVDSVITPVVTPTPEPDPEPVVVEPTPIVVEPEPITEPVVETKPEPIPELPPAEPTPKPAPGTAPLVFEPMPAPKPVIKKAKTLNVFQNILKWLQEHLF